MWSHLDQNELSVGTRWEEFDEGCRLIWETHVPQNDLSRFLLALMGHHINTRRESPEMKRPLVRRDISNYLLMLSCS